MRKINEYFFGEPEIAISDWLWFYGSLIFISVVGLLSWIIGQLPV